MIEVVLALASVLAVAFGQSGSGAVRQGPDWVQTTNGSLNLPATGRLRLVTAGSVVVRGESAKDSAYTLTKRVRAQSEAEAQRLLMDFAIRTRVQGDWTYLTVAAPGRGASSDLVLMLPRSLRQVVMQTQGGNLEAYDLAGPAEASTFGGRIRLDRMGSSVNVRTGGGEVNLGKITGPLRCLSGGGSIHVDSVSGEAVCDTAGGEIYVREVGGPLQATTAGGNIRVERAGGAVVARTAGGLIDVQQAGGLVSAETNGGSIQVGSARGVRCESGAGAIRLRGVSGALRASTAIGSILADLLSGARLEESFLTTAGGDITVFIPSNLAVTVRAQSNIGGGTSRIISEFNEIKIRNDGRRSQPLLAEGSLNGGGPLLSIAASNGVIYIRRQK